MTNEKLAAVKAEVWRFGERIKALEKARADNVRAGWHHALCPKETGAVRRASMELTRALADLRRRQ